MVEDRTFSEGEDDEEDDGAAVRGGGGGDPVLLSMLKDLRRDVARKLRLQPWVVFSDPALEDMTIMYPLSLKELSEKCQGVGEGKAHKFGKPFVDLIAKYVEEKQGDINMINVYGQESEPATYRLAKMNLGVRGLSNHLGETNASTFTNDQHKGKWFNYIMANY